MFSLISISLSTLQDLLPRSYNAPKTRILWFLGKIMSVSSTEATQALHVNPRIATITPAGDDDMSVFLPPIVRSAGPLNRALFTKTLQLAAARVNDVRDIARYRKALTASKELLLADRLGVVVDDPTNAPEQGAAAGPRKKCLLLRHGISAEGRSCVYFESRALR